MSDSTRTGGLDAVRSGRWWQAFTGLVPVILMVPILLAEAYALGVLVAFVGVAVVIAYHLRRGQGVSSLDALAAAFAVANVVLYFGFDSTLLIEHLDAAFYTLLALQALFSLRGDTPWTTQFSRRTVVPDLWSTDAFVAMNLHTTRLWAACFVLCDVAALTLPDPSRVWVPVALMIATVIVSRRVGRRVLADRLQAARSRQGDAEPAG
ncbi:hypothetical protein ACT8ZV_17920 [Nocardioides sp. MAHUQ-72]|uniref:hypothetical protein n=1 Tax=unclassified Nocardioides TaxID=2615069 RepID=UPI003617A760